MSYNNVGLSTPRGSATSGYVQSNKFKPNPNITNKPLPSSSSSSSSSKPVEMKKPMSKDIAEHERKRKIEAELLILSETLADQGYTEAEIAEKVWQLRKALESDTVKNS